MKIKVENLESGEVKVSFNGYRGRTLPDREVAAVYIDGVTQGYQGFLDKYTNVEIEETP